jgi:hypothetical protein
MGWLEIRRIEWSGNNQWIDVAMSERVAQAKEDGISRYGSYFLSMTFGLERVLSGIETTLQLSGEN